MDDSVGSEERVSKITLNPDLARVIAAEPPAIPETIINTSVEFIEILSQESQKKRRMKVKFVHLHPSNNS